MSLPSWEHDFLYAIRLPANAVLEREITERLTLGAELFGNTPKERDERADVAFHVGGAWQVRPQKLTDSVKW